MACKMISSSHLYMPFYLFFLRTFILQLVFDCDIRILICNRMQYQQNVAAQRNDINLFTKHTKESSLLWLRLQDRLLRSVHFFH